MVKKQGFIMKIKNGTGILLIVVTALHGADTPQIPLIVSDAATGAQIPPDNYYSSANLARLTTKGEKKHAPLAIIIDEVNQENPDSDYQALTANLAHMLQTAFVPTIVSRSIVYNYFFRRNRARVDKDDPNDDHWFIPQNNPVLFNKWHLYDVPRSQFFLFVPDHYLKHYKDSPGLNLDCLTDISAKLPTAQDYDTIIDYINDYKKASQFSIGNLRSILITIKSSEHALTKDLTKAELKQLAQLPIWDIILHGHGVYTSAIGSAIGGIPPAKAQELLTFLDNELPVGLLYIESCHAGGKNLNLLEFYQTINEEKDASPVDPFFALLVELQSDETINEENVLRNLDYILIVGSITDKTTWTFSGGQSNKLFYQLYSDAALLQGKGKLLDTLLNNLNSLYRHSGSPHGSSNIPQVWLPGGLGFQTYQINNKVQIIGNVKARVHEEEKRNIVLSDSLMAVLVYANRIEVPILVKPHVLKIESRQDLRNEFVDLRAKWIKNIPNVAEALLLVQKLPEKLESYSALKPILSKDSENRIAIKALNLLYPEFISMLRGNSIQYFSKIVLRPPEGEEKELTGVMHFIRDTFFDIGDQATTKTFLIEELIGNNDISALLELSRLKNGDADPHPLEKQLANSIGKKITLEKVIIETSKHYAQLRFIFDGTAWSFGFEPKQPIFWNFVQDFHEETHILLWNESVQKVTRPEKIVQKTISEILIKDAR